MPSTQATYDDANLILRLYELRRDEKLREARAWFAANFTVKSPEELQRIAPPGSKENAYVRMVVSYWEMAASLVTTGAIDGDAFRAAHGEIIGTFCKIQPHLAELRAVSGEADICKHMEAVVLAIPDAEALLSRRREWFRAAAAARESAKSAT